MVGSASMKMSCVSISAVASNFFSFPSRLTGRRRRSVSKICCSRKDNLSVLRFTLGIRGFDESYLPRYIGYAFGALLMLNHFTGSSSVTPAQLSSEAIGLSLAVFSIAVPHVGKFLKGSSPNLEKTIPEGVDQTFVMSDGIPDDMKEDLAWGTYALLRNTNAISVLIFMEDALCARGYWNLPPRLSKEDACRWFRSKIECNGLSELKGSPQYLGLNPEIEEMFHEGIDDSLLVQSIDEKKSRGSFLLLASSSDLTLITDGDKAWVAAVANKFRARRRQPTKPNKLS